MAGENRVSGIVMICEKLLCQSSELSDMGMVSREDKRSNATRMNKVNKD